MSSTNNCNNYIIFAGKNNKGGWNDFYGFADTLLNAVDKYKDASINNNWVHVVDVLENKIILSKNVFDEEPEQQEQPEQKKVYKKRQPKCRGCAENQPNQMAHMDYGGCLHYDF